MAADPLGSIVGRLAGAADTVGPPGPRRPPRSRSPPACRSRPACSARRWRWWCVLWARLRRVRDRLPVPRPGVARARSARPAPGRGCPDWPAPACCPRRVSRCSAPACWPTRPVRPSAVGAGGVTGAVLTAVVGMSLRRAGRDRKSGRADARTNSIMTSVSPVPSTLVVPPPMGMRERNGLVAGHGRLTSPTFVTCALLPGGPAAERGNGHVRRARGAHHSHDASLSPPPDGIAAEHGNGADQVRSSPDRTISIPFRLLSGPESRRGGHCGASRPGCWC